MITKKSLENKIVYNSDDKKISFALMSSFIILTIQYFILINFNLLNTTGASVIQLISKILVGASFAYAFPSMWKRSKIKFLLIYFVAIFIFLINYKIHPDNHEYLNALIIPFFFMCLPAYIYSMSIKNWQIFKSIMHKASFIVFIFGAILGILILSGKAFLGSYSMALSYYMLLPAIIFLNKLLERFSLKLLIFFLISIVIILSLGSRGAILCLGLFIVLKLLRNIILATSYTGFFQTLVIIGLIIIIFLQIDKIIVFLNTTMLYFGIESRTLRLLLSDEISLSGRENIYSSVINALVENPLLGIGLGADRKFTTTGYVHNFYLEVLANFGVVVGSLFLILLTFLIIKSLFIKNKDLYSLVIMWISLGFIHLMVSSSYLIDIKFWIFMGLITNLLIVKRSHVDEENFLSKEL